MNNWVQKKKNKIDSDLYLILSITYKEILNHVKS